jgi:hypothetical protein
LLPVVPLGAFALALVVARFEDEDFSFFDAFWASAVERLRNALQTIIKVSGFMFIGLFLPFATPVVVNTSR